ncbi:MAG: FadR/GntR family transcriptional regulator [Marinobacter sp.]|uniref:FadR/GntR family transcriptional regulator n=1 Tax=Marinobacter sp. TaxID=50741 RepID=UPI00299CF905|nr:FadR/GntR family transcriptional regulator [Marinobacter sp.]MDX1755542.1 FadR/GntR family transcriptional regulator [Marinobacter sp.]
MTLARISKGSLVDTALESLRSAIEGGQWRVGDRLPVEAELSQALGVSRNTVREAVRVLVHVGMLETRQGDGTYVRATRDAGETMRRIERARLQDQLEVRQMLESEAAGLAASRRTPEELQAMSDALDRRAQAGDDIPARIEHDNDFHHAVVQASHNSALIELYGYFAQAITRTIERTEMDAELPEPTQAAHELLLAAIRRQAPEQAAHQAKALLQPCLDALQSKD